MFPCKRAHKQLRRKLHVPASLGKNSASVGIVPLGDEHGNDGVMSRNAPPNGSVACVKGVSESRESSARHPTAPHGLHHYPLSKQRRRRVQRRNPGHLGGKARLHHILSTPSVQRWLSPQPSGADGLSIQGTKNTLQRARHCKTVLARSRSLNRNFEQDEPWGRWRVLWESCLGANIFDIDILFRLFVCSFAPKRFGMRRK